MKKLLVLLILLMFLLSGCGIFDLDGWIVPDDEEFIAVIESLDTPKKIGNYMKDNFEIEEHPYISLTPYQLYITQKGDCNDFSSFSTWIANFHGYETYQILIFFPKPIYPVNTWHAIAIYKENNCYTFSENQYYNPYDECYNSFIEIAFEFNGWISYTVYDFWNDVIEQVTK